MCDRFHKLPSEVQAESTHLLQLIRIEQLGRNAAEKARQQSEDPPDMPTY